MKVVAVIPARGGSKSIPRKNIQPLDGKPLISYSINYAKKCSIVSNTVVSTDCTEIQSIALEHGAEAPFLRPSELAGDLIQDFPVMDHALRFLENYYNEKIDIVILLRPTSPLRPQGLIEKSIELLNKYPEAASVRAVTKTNQHPYRQWEWSGSFIKGVLEDKVVESYNIPRQLLPEMFFQSGEIETIRRETILSGSVSGKNVLPLIIDQGEIIDIDHPEDFNRAKAKLEESKS